VLDALRRWCVLLAQGVVRAEPQLAAEESA